MTAAIAPACRRSAPATPSPTARTCHGRAAACRRRRPGRWRCATCSRQRGSRPVSEEAAERARARVEADAARARAEAELARGCGAPYRRRVTVTAAERALPAASKARTDDGVHAEDVHRPAVKVAAYGALVSRATRAPSTENSTLPRRGRRWPWRPCSALEVNVAPAAGAESVTVGASPSEPEPDPPATGSAARATARTAARDGDRRPAGARRRRVDVARRVGRADVDRVLGQTEPRVGLRRRAAAHAPPSSRHSNVAPDSSR